MKKVLLLLIISFAQHVSAQVHLPAYQGVQASSAGCMTDVDVLSFFARQVSAGITLTTGQKAAYAALVCEFKAAGAWADLIEGGPQLGGTSAAHAILMKGGTATFMGSPTHSSTGTAFNGTTQYIKTGILGSSLTNNDYCLAYYSGTSTGFGAPEHVMGAYTSNSAYLALTARTSSGNALFYATTATNALSVTNSDGSGLIIGNRTSSTFAGIYRNTTTLLTSTVANTGTLPSLEIYVNALNNGGSPGLYSSKECRAWFLFKGLASGKLAAVQAAIINYETALGRN